jgi:thymidylate synthase (FAD)
MLINRGHEAMIEHYSFSVKFIVDRGVSHEMVRHRLCAVAQESTRYCNYSKDKFDNGVTFILPYFWKDTVNDVLLLNRWKDSIRSAENIYLELIKAGSSPQEARSVLPNSLKTEIVITANLREWRHILKLRTASQAHPQMREVMCPLLDELKIKVPVVFDDIKYEKTI